MVAETSQLEALAREGIELTRAPGIVIASVDAEGRSSIAAAGTSSLRLGDPMTVEKRFAVGSIGKTVAAVIVHQLVREGLLDLRRTCAAYLDPDIIEGIAHADTAPLKTLLNHTSGIYSWEFDPEWIRRGRGDRFMPGHPFDRADTLVYVRGRPSSTGSIGKIYSYANTNHTLLGLVVEAVTHRLYTEEARRRVFDPNRLDSFAMESFEAIPEGAMAGAHHLATAFFRRTAGIHPSFPEVAQDIIDTSAADLSPEWAAGGFVSSVGDLARYGWLLMTNAFGEDVGDQMRAFEKFVGVPELPKPRRVGLGLFEFPSPAGSVAGHFGGTLGYCAALLFPSTTRGAVVGVGFNLGRMHTAAEGEHAAWQDWVIDVVYPAVAHQ